MSRYEIPSDERAEQMSLAAIMRGDKATRATALSELHADMYQHYHDVARPVFALLSEGGIPDAESVVAQMGEDKRIRVIDAVHRQVPSENLSVYAKRVKTAYLRRQYIGAASRIIDTAEDTDHDAKAIRATAEEEIIGLSTETTDDHARAVTEYTMDSLEDLLDEDGRVVTGFAGTGFRKIDQYLRGYHGGRLHIIGGRTSQGKTAYMLSSLLHACSKDGARAVIYTNEMPAKMLTRRLILMQAKQKQRLYYSEAEEQALRDAAAQIYDLPLWIVEAHSMDALDIQSSIRRMRLEEGINIAAIDYQQNMRALDGMDRRHEWAKESARIFKSTSIDQDVCMLLGSQITRAATSNADNRPSKAMLRDAGEDDADSVLLVWRPQEYGITHYEDGTETEGTGTLILDKNRHGPTGTVRAAWMGTCARWLPLDHRDEPAQHASRNGNDRPSAPVPSNPPF